jgi:hypothetical protein
VIWEQKIVLPSDAGLQGADYRLCFRYLPLPQCCFDIQAKPFILVDGGKIPLTDVCDEDKGCGHLYAATFHGAGTVNVQIVLPEDGMGDGNDLLIDNISMVKIVPVPANQLTFSPDAENVANGMFDVTSVIAPGLASTCTWDWELYRGACHRMSWTRHCSHSCNHPLNQINRRVHLPASPSVMGTGSRYCTGSS